MDRENNQRTWDKVIDLIINRSNGHEIIFSKIGTGSV